MKKIFFIFTFVLILAADLFSQLPNQNTYLLAQKDEHGNGYSACWGYTAPNGREYAILGCNTGTAFVEITDTANIVERDFVTGVSSGWREMKVFSNYCYVASEGNNSRIQIINMQYLPDSVSLVATTSIAGHTTTHTISQSGPYLYLNGCNSSFGQGVTVLDLTANPLVPVRRGSYNTQYVHDCRIVNDTIWAANIYFPPGTISVISATNKDALSLVTTWVNNPQPGPHNIALTPDRRHAFVTDEIGGNPRVLKVWNVQNLQNVTFVTSWQPTNITGSIVHNVEIYNNIAVIAHYTAGIRILNISNPAVPQEIAWYDTYITNNGGSYSGCWGVFMFPSGKVIGSDISGGLFVIKSTLNLVGINNENNNAPSAYQLKQNYPNPFNPSTTIEYSIPKSSYVTVRVFDALGKQVGILTDEYKNAGNYKINYDAGRLASGIYYYSINAGDYMESKKMILVK